MAAHSETRAVPRDMDRDREDRLCAAFLALADPLDNEHGVDAEPFAALVDRCGALFGADSAGVLLAASGGELSAGAASGPDAHALGVWQCQTGHGPGPQAHRSGIPVEVPDLAAATDPWPVPAAAARHGVIAAVHAVPLRAHRRGNGALCLYWTRPHPLPATDLALAQALADAATLGALHQEETTRARVLVEQLQHALHSRVVIEQAKGVIAQRLGLAIAESFEALRRHARGHNTPLPELARRIVAGELTPDQLGVRPPARPTDPKGTRPAPAALITRDGPGTAPAVPGPEARGAGTPRPAPPAPAALSCRSQTWTTPEGQVLVLALAGTADPHALAVPVLALALNTALDQRPHALVVDLDGLTAASPATFNLLAEAARIAAANGTGYALAALPPVLGRRYLRVLRGQVALYPNAVLAVAGLHQPAPVPTPTRPG